MKTFSHTVSIATLGASLAILFSACNTPPTNSRSQVYNSSTITTARCSDCGTISRIEEMKSKGSGSGIGAVLGAVAGAVVGHQIGDGRGQDVATVAGAVGGGLAGNEIEKRVNGTSYFHVTVAMENGSTNTVDVDTLNGLATGNRVRIIGNNVQVIGS